jgi:serine/threonine protein kinase
MDAAPEPEDDDPLIGQSLSDRYRVLRKLGEGGMGAVYEAEHTLIRKRVAVKVLHPEYSQNPDVVSRFHNEALAATGIGNEHIVEVTDMGRLAGGGMFMVLELLAGRDFATLIEDEGPLAAGRAVRIVRQMCDGLAAAHAKGIVHRDLKPENVFLITRHGDPEFVKILDFGISKMMSADESEPRAKTRTGMVMGTALYMPPEQARGLKEVDHRADIYALGVILYRALSVEYPFQGQTYADLVVKILTEEPVPLSEHRPDLPPGLQAVIARCLAKDAAARYPSCAQLASALEPFEEVNDAAPSRRRAAASVDPSGATMPGPATPTPSTRDAFAETLLPDSAIRTKDTAKAEPAADSVAKPPPEPPPTESAARTTSRRTIATVVLGVAFVAVVGIVGAAMYEPDLPATADTPRIASLASEPVQPAPEPEAPPEPEPPVRAPEPSSAPTVAVHITTAPVTDAELFLDGAPIANPFNASLPRSTELHTLEARAPNFRTYLRHISLAYSQEIAITLRRGSGLDDRREARVDPARVEAPEAPDETPPPPAADPEPPPADPEPAPTIVVPPPPRALKRLTSH